MPSKLTTEEFIKRSIKAHGLVYDYSETIYNGWGSKVRILCKEHGIFLQNAQDHINGHGCTQCYLYKNKDINRSTLSKFIDNANKVHGNKYDYSLSEYVGNKTKTKIICPIHGEFWQKPNSHLSGTGCPKCSIHKKSIDKSDSEELFINKAISIHGDRYDYSNLNFSHNNRIVTIICPIHGMFSQRKAQHLSGRGCKKCAVSYVSDKSKKTIDDFLLEAKEKHGDKYDYSLVKYNGRNEKVSIICPKHGVFEQTPTSHCYQGSGCNKCIREENGVSQRNNTESFIASAMAVHGDRYDYSKTEYIKNKEKVLVVCHIHGEFTTYPKNHLNGAGCHHCSKGSSPFDRDGWVKRAKNKLGVFYIIRCFNDNESFYKFGITFNSLKNRYQSKTAMPYSYEIVRLIISSDKEYIWDLEKRFSKFKKQNQYYPKILFAGSSSECFSDYTYKKEKQE